MDFIIRKDIYGSWWHDYNNNATKVSISDFECVIDDVANTFIIQNKNGSNVPSKAVSIADVKVIDQNISETPIAFSGAVGLKNLLTAKLYPPYRESSINYDQKIIWRKGHAIVWNETQEFFNANFDANGLGINLAEGWGLCNGNAGRKDFRDRTIVSKGANFATLYNTGGSANAVLIGHDHESAVLSNGRKGVNVLGTGATFNGNVLVGAEANQKIVKTSIKGQSNTGADVPSETGVGKNMPPYIIAQWVERVSDLIVYYTGSEGGGAVDSVNGQTGVVVIPLDYLPLAGGTMDDGADIFFDNGSKISEGAVDAGTGGSKGIALTCAVGFEWKFEAGEAYLTETTSGYINIKHYARSLPTVNDDITKGFISGSKWYNDNFTYFYECTDPTVGAAVWEQRFAELNLQQVTDVGAITTNLVTFGDSGTGIYTEVEAQGVTSYDVTNNYTSQYLYSGFFTGDTSSNQGVSILPSEIILQTSGVGAVYLKSDNLLVNYTAQFPVKASNSTQTIAMLSDIPAAGVTSVGLTMPSAFTVTNSPITSSGDIAVTGAGAVSQYVRGDGTLANFPTSSGGGSSLSFYLNGSVSQGTIGGVAFREMDRTPILGAGTDFTINANGYIQSFITDAGVPNLLEIPAGNWNFETYFSASSGGGSPSFYVELYKWDGATLSLIASNSANPEFITGGTNTDLYVSALAVPQTTLLATDRLAVRIYVTHSGRTITLHTEDNNLCQIITTFSTGLTALNGLTAQVQNLATGTGGTDFGIVSSGSTHTFNLPNASATNDRGLLTSANWTTFNNKQNTATLIFDSLQKAIMRDNYFWFLPNTISTGVAAGFGYSERLGGNTFTLSNSGTLLRGLIPFSSTATAGTIAFMRKNDAMILTGLEVVFTRKIQFNSNVSGQRFFCGISKGNQFTPPTNVEPSTLTDIVGVCQLSSSTNMHVVHNDASGTATTIDLGSSYPCTDSQYNYYITIEQTTTSYIVTVERVTVATGVSISTTNTLSTNIPNYATGTIQLLTWISNNATAAVASYLDGGAIGNVKNQ